LAEEKGSPARDSLTLFVLIFIQRIRIVKARRATSSAILAGGVFALLFSHVFIKIGMKPTIDARYGRATAAAELWRVLQWSLLIAISFSHNIYIYRSPNNYE